MPDRLRDERHALYVGYIIGRAMRHGLTLLPVQDAGDATDTVRLYLPDRPGALLGHVDLIVPYPPADWRFVAGPDVAGPQLVHGDEARPGDPA